MGHIFLDPYERERKRLEELQLQQQRLQRDLEEQRRHYPTREEREIEDLKRELAHVNNELARALSELTEWQHDPEAKREKLFNQAVQRAARVEVNKTLAPIKAELAEKADLLAKADKQMQQFVGQVKSLESKLSDSQHATKVSDGKNAQLTQEAQQLREQIKALKAELAPLKIKEAAEQAARDKQDRLDQAEAAKQFEEFQRVQALTEQQKAIDKVTPNREQVRQFLSDDNLNRQGKPKPMPERVQQVASLLHQYPVSTRAEFLESLKDEFPRETDAIFQKADMVHHPRFVELGRVFSQTRQGTYKPEPEPKPSAPKPVDPEHAKAAQEQQQLEQQQRQAEDAALVQSEAQQIIDEFNDQAGGLARDRIKALPEKQRVPVFRFIKTNAPKVWDRELKQWHTDELLEVEQANTNIEEQPSSVEPTNFKATASKQLEPSTEKQQGKPTFDKVEPNAQNLVSSKTKAGFIDTDDGSSLRLSPEPDGKVTGQLEPASNVSILGKYRYNGDWVYVQGISKGSMLSGWMRNNRIESQKPEPRAKLHQIKAGETPEGLARANFREAAQPGMDYRFYVNALIYVNEQDKRSGIQAPFLPFTEPSLKAGERIWLLSPEFARSLKGVVGNGSITNGAFAKAREANTALPDTLESLAMAFTLADDVMQKDIWNALSEHWLELIGMTTLFVGAELATVALTAAPEPTVTKVAAAAILQSILAAFAAYGTVTATAAALSEGQQWLETASNAKGNPKEIKKASVHLIRMLENVGLALLSTVQGKANGAKSLELSQNFKLPKIPGMQPQGVTPGGVQVNVPESQNANQATNANRTGNTNTPANNPWLARIAELEPNYKKFNNWVDVQKFIGQTASETTCPPGYKYAKIVDGGKTMHYAYLEQSGSNLVPQLKSTNGVWDAYKKPDYRIANEDRYKANYGTKVLESGKESQIHHLVGDSVWRQVDVLQEILRRGIAYMDEKLNLIELAVDNAALAKAKLIEPDFPEVLHFSEHPKFDFMVAELLEAKVIREKRNGLPKDITKWLDKDLLKILKKVVDEVREKILKDPNSLPRKKNGTLGNIPQDDESEEA